MPNGKYCANGKYFRGLAAQCRQLAQLCSEPEMSSELKEIADELTARANELDRGPQGNIDPN
jgi:hypothetical protein